MAACRVTRENMVHLMVQTPYSLFVYWDISGDYLEMARESLQGVEPGLRIRLLQDAGTGDVPVEDVAVPETMLLGSWYFNGQRPCAVYTAELGFIYHGGFFTLLRTERILTPPSAGVEEKQQARTALKEALPILPFTYSPSEKPLPGGE